MEGLCMCFVRSAQEAPADVEREWFNLEIRRQPKLKEMREREEAKAGWPDRCKIYVTDKADSSSCANASVSQCIESAVTDRECALRYDTADWQTQCVPLREPFGNGHPGVGYDTGFAWLRVHFSSSSDRSWDAARVAAGALASKCLAPQAAPAQFAYGGYALHRSSSGTSGDLFVRIGVAPNASSAPASPKLFAEQLPTAGGGRFGRCAAASSQVLAFDVVDGAQTNDCGNGAVDRGEECDSSDYCDPKTCACGQGTRATAAGACVPDVMCALVTLYADAEPAGFAGLLAEAAGKCVDPSEVQVTVARARSKASRFRALVSPASGHYPGARAPAAVQSEDVFKCFVLAAQQALGSTMVKVGPLMVYDPAHPTGDDGSASVTGASSSSATARVCSAALVSGILAALGVGRV
eukprot:m51a1_g10519 hypothetical protein (410) ;mRNA; f:214461-216995